jgi:hypothetical protein
VSGWDAFHAARAGGSPEPVFADEPEPVGPEYSPLVAYALRSRQERILNGDPPRPFDAEEARAAFVASARASVQNCIDMHGLETARKIDDLVGGLPGVDDLLGREPVAEDVESLEALDGFEEPMVWPSPPERQRASRFRVRLPRWFAVRLERRRLRRRLAELRLARQRQVAAEIENRLAERRSDEARRKAERRELKRRLTKLERDFGIWKRLGEMELALTGATNEHGDIEEDND